MTVAAIDNLIKLSIGPILKEAGFAKKARTWNRSVGDLVYVVDLQESRYSDSRHLRFTLNLGVCLPKAFSICWGRAVSNFVKETDCLLRKRVGELLDISDSKMPIDYWWKLEAANDVTLVGSEVATVIRDRILPYLESINSLESLRNAIAKRVTKGRRDMPSTIYLAILTAMLGDVGKAKDLLAQARLSATDAWKARVDYVFEHLQDKE